MAAADGVSGGRTHDIISMRRRAHSVSTSSSRLPTSVRTVKAIPPPSCSSVDADICAGWGGGGEDVGWVRDVRPKKRPSEQRDGAPRTHQRAERLQLRHDDEDAVRVVDGGDVRPPALDVLREGKMAVG